MNENAPEWESNKKELEMMVRGILKEERMEKETKMTPEISTQNGNDYLIAEARKAIETSILAHAERNSLPKSEDAARIKNVMEKITKALASKERPKKIFLDTCSKADDTCKTYVWWKNFFSGLNLYPYVFSAEFFPEERDDWMLYASYYKLVLKC